MGALVLLSALLFTSPTPFPQASSRFPGGSGDDSPCRLLEVGRCVTEAAAPSGSPRAPLPPLTASDPSRVGVGVPTFFFFIILCHNKVNKGTDQMTRECYSGGGGRMASPSTRRTGCVVGRVPLTSIPALLVQARSLDQLMGTSCELVRRADAQAHFRPAGSETPF